MELPILDVGALERGESIDALRQACTGTGFFYITGHGVPDSLIEATVEQARRFFTQPLEQREATSLKNWPCARGYEAMKTQTLEPGMPPDLKEGYYIGTEKELDLSGVFPEGPNQWPATLPEFRPAMESYFTALQDLSIRMMRPMAMSLGLDANYFDAFCADPTSVLRLLHYPTQPPNPQPGEKGCGAHTDWGCLTLLWQDAAGGLQVRMGDSEWVDAPPVPGTFVVNIADMFARWTNNRYRSTLHRVVNASGKDRYSIPFFFEGSLTHPVVALPGCVEPGAEPLFAPTTVAQHMADMYRQTYAA